MSFADIAQDKSQNIEVDVSIHVKQKDFEEGPDIFVKSTKHIVGRYLSYYAERESRQTDEHPKRADVTDVSKH